MGVGFDTVDLWLRKLGYAENSGLGVTYAGRLVFGEV